MNKDSAPTVNANIDPFGSVSNQQTSLSVTEDVSVVGGARNQEHNDATVFVDDAQIVTRDASHVAHIDNTILSLNDTNLDEQSIKTFLSRPVIIQQGNFSISDTYSFLNSTSQPYSAFNTAEAVVWREKLRGIFGIRMDMKFRIVVNANRFQQGRYCMSWMPLAGPVRSTSGLKELAINNAHMATLVQRTTVPRVELDLCDDTVGELLVPFVSTRTFYNLTSIVQGVDNNPLGYLNIYPYSPLVSPAGSTTAGFTVYLSFENIRLFGAASPQSGLGRRKHKDQQKNEITNPNLGPVSSVSSALSKGFKEFAHIPLLSTYANSISWVADRVTSVASVFGWSKPNQGDSMSKFQLLQAPNHTTVDGDSDARALSYLCQPGVVALDGISGTTYDEMDFAYIARKPAWFQTMTFNTSMLAGALITEGSFSVFPYVEVTIGGATHFQPVAFVSEFFSVWRGSLRYRFKFVRTEFHSGRLSVAFYPTTLGAAYTGNPVYVHRMIIDVRESTEVEFVVPYIADTPWISTRTGIVQVTVVDPLVAPDTVSSSVTILCEISGGDDFEVAIPDTSEHHTPTTFIPQSGLNESKLVTMNIGNSTVVSDPTISSSTCIGDKVSSFRAYLKRYAPLRLLNSAAAELTNFNSANLLVYPDTIYYTTTTAPANYIRADPYSMIASCYAITRGGMRIRDVINKNMLQGTSSTPHGPSMIKVSSLTETANTFFDTKPTAISGTGSEVHMNAHLTIQDLSQNGVVSVESPQYTRTLAKSVVDMIDIQGGTGSAVGPSSSATQQIVTFNLPQSSVISLPSIEGQSLHTLYRAIADDADFGLFISVPPMRIETPTVLRLSLY